MEKDTLYWEVSAEDAGKRLDVFLAEKTGQSRSYLQKLIRQGDVTVNGASSKANFKLSEACRLQLNLPEEVEPDIVPEDIPLDILYEDAHLLVVNKPKQMVVHPAAGHYEHTLVNAVMFHCKEHLSGINGVLRPGIVHRIDMDTTGALVICKTDQAHRILAEDLARHDITRKYFAIVHDNLKEDDITIRKPIGRSPSDRKKMSVHGINARDAVTHVHVLERFGKYTYVECTLETGRTHQIRVHLASIGHPVLGDPVYGPARCPLKQLQGQTLHAGILGFRHPISGEYVEFQAPLPAYFQALLEKFRAFSCE